MIPIFISVIGFPQETKTPGAYLIIKNNGDQIKATTDGMYTSMPNVREEYSYDIRISNESNIDPYFFCQGLGNSGTAMMPLINVVFACNWLSKAFVFSLDFFWRFFP